MPNFDPQLYLLVKGVASTLNNLRLNFPENDQFIDRDVQVSVQQGDLVLEDDQEEEKDDYLDQVAQVHRLLPDYEGE